MTDQPDSIVVAPVHADAPVMIAWTAYKEGDAYKNTLKWANSPDHAEGSLWAAFYQGFFACAVRNAEAAPKPATTPPDEMVALELAARNFPDGPGAKERLAIAALNYARAAIAALTEGRGG